MAGSEPTSVLGTVGDGVLLRSLDFYCVTLAGVAGGVHIDALHAALDDPLKSGEPERECQQFLYDLAELARPVFRVQVFQRAVQFGTHGYLIGDERMARRWASSRRTRK